MNNSVTMKRIAAMSAGVVLSIVLLGTPTLPSMLASQGTPEVDTAARVALNDKYMAEAQEAFAEQLLEEEKLFNYTDQRQKAVSEEEKRDLDTKIQESMERLSLIDKEFQRIEQLNIELFKLPPEIEDKLYSVEKSLIDRYLDRTSKNYVGENPVVVIDTFPLTASITMRIDPDKVASDGSNVPVETNIEGIPIKVEHGKPVEISCTPDNPLNGVCRPVLGGVSTSEQQNAIPGTSKNTIGYKATKGGQNGFVMAGHSAVGPGKIIVQPYRDFEKRVGVVPSSGAFCYSGFTCDFAWVDLDSGISIQDDIYTTCYTCRYDIAYKDPESSQQPGNLIKKAGVGLGVTQGQITSNSPNNHYILTDMNAAAGDSGAPAFWNTGVIARLQGVVFSATQDFQNTYYFPQDWVQSQIGAVASTT